MAFKTLMYVFVLLFNILTAPVFGKDKSEMSHANTEHLVSAKLLFDEISDIDISKGHYRVSVELLLIWDGNTDLFLNKFGEEIIHGSKLESFLEKV